MSNLPPPHLNVAVVTPLLEWAGVDWQGRTPLPAMDSPRENCESAGEAANGPPNCSIALLGGFALKVRGVPVSLPTRKSAALLATLSLQEGVRIRREALMAELWPDVQEEAARNSLRQALSSLRRALEASGLDEDLIDADRQTISFKAGSARIDVAEFEEYLRAAKKAEADAKIEALKCAVGVYAGSLLAGFDEAWIAHERARLEGLFVSCAADLADALNEYGRPDEALPFAWRAVVANDLSEPARISLVRTLVALGRVSEAKQQVLEFDRVLATELAAEPAPGTKRVFEHLLTPVDQRSDSTIPSPSPLPPVPLPLPRIRPRWLLPALVASLTCVAVALAIVYLAPRRPMAAFSPGIGFDVVGLSTGAASSSLGPSTHAGQTACFVENRGQWNSSALFLARSQGIDSWITRDGIVYDLYREGKNRVGYAVKMSFEGASGALRPVPSDELPGRISYYFGADRTKWASGTHAYRQIEAPEVYKGISVRFYFDGGRPRYDIVVAPGANPSNIRLRFGGPVSLRLLESGALRIGTGLGSLEQRDLFAYQRVGSRREQVDCKMLLEGQVVRLHLAAYDRSRPLVIDPLVFSTLLDGNGSTPCEAIALDSKSNIFVCGRAYRPEFPTSLGAYGRVCPTNNLVAKFSPSGKTLLWTAYFGSSLEDHCYGLALDPAGNVLVVGYTASSDFPVTAGAFQTTSKNPQGGNAYVAKLSPSGDSLLYSTYLGGRGSASGMSIASDAQGNAVVCGETYEDFPVTDGAYQTHYRGAGRNNGFVAKLSANGRSLLFGTYLGGSGNKSKGRFEPTTAHEGDTCIIVHLDSNENIVVAGTTYSSDFPVTPGAFQAKLKGYQSAFVTKLSSDGKSAIFSTHFGGSKTDPCNAMVLDREGDPVIAGNTLSADMPVTRDAYQSTLKEAGGRSNCYVAKLSRNGSSLLFATYLGDRSDGGIGTLGNALALDPFGNVFVAGATRSVSFPVTRGAVQPTNNDPSTGVGYVAELSANGRSLLYGSYLGGIGGDSCRGLALDAAGNIIVVGRTSSPEFPVTPDAYQTASLSADGSGFITKLSP